jgi:hypothetical protein
MSMKKVRAPLTGRYHTFYGKMSELSYKSDSEVACRKSLGLLQIWRVVLELVDN